MSINITRREAAQVYIAAVCSAWVTVLGTGIALVENTASLSRYFQLTAISDRPHHYAVAEAARVQVTDSTFGVLLESEASFPKAINREAGTSQQADRDSTIETKRAVSSRSEGMPPRKDLPIHPGMTLWRDTGCAIYPQVSIGSERSDLRVILPTSGAVPVDSSHGVRRVLGPVESWLTETVPGLACCRRERGALWTPPSLVGSTQGGVRPVPAALRGTDAAGSLQMLGGGAAWKDTQDITESRWSGGYEKRERERLSVKRFEDRVCVQRTTSGLMGKPSEITYRGVLLGPESSAAGIKPGRHLQAFASAAAHLCAVPEPILFALISVESSWRQTDKAGGTLRSRSGALGLTQIKPSTAREVSATLDPHQASQNAIAGACYLRQQYDRFGSWGIALKAYRVGPNSPALHDRTARDYSTAILGGAQ